MNIDDPETIEENVEDIPEEVRDFIFGDEMTTIKEKIRGYIPTDSEYIALENTLMLFLLNSEDFESVVHAVDTLTISEENKTAIRKIIKEDIIEDLQLLMEILEEQTPKASAPATLASTPTSATLSRISQTFNTPATLAPTKRTYTEVPSATTTSKPLTETLPIKHAVDPYRELPEEK